MDSNDNRQDVNDPSANKNVSKSRYRFNVKLLYRRTALIMYDILAIIAASYLAVIIRYEFQLDAVPAHFRQPIERLLPINIIFTIGLFFIFRLYDSLWAYAGEAELQNIVISCFLSGVFNIVGLQFFRQKEQAVPKSYYFLYVFLLISFEFVSRF